MVVYKWVVHSYIMPAYGQYSVRDFAPKSIAIRCQPYLTSIHVPETFLMGADGRLIVLAVSPGGQRSDD
jgi:hypothetical protein